MERGTSPSPGPVGHQTQLVYQIPRCLPLPEGSSGAVSTGSVKAGKIWGGPGCDTGAQPAGPPITARHGLPEPWHKAARSTGCQRGELPAQTNTLQPSLRTGRTDRGLGSKPEPTATKPDQNPDLNTPECE